MFMYRSQPSSHYIVITDLFFNLFLPPPDVPPPTSQIYTKYIQKAEQFSGKGIELYLGSSPTSVS